MRLIKYLVVHCSDSPHRGDTAETIHLWHKERGFDGVGYHAVIDEHGGIERGRPEYWAGAHVRGYNNESLGVCLIGKDSFAPLQLLALASLILEWKQEHPHAMVVGHRDLDPNKTCPNFNVQEWYGKVTTNP